MMQSSSINAAAAAAGSSSSSTCRRGAAAQAPASMHQQHQRRRQQLVCRAGPPPPPQVSTTTVQQPQRQPPQQPPPKARKLQRHERLRDPAKIGAQGSATVSVNDAGGPVSLATYMQLPVEQYYILDPNQITLLSGNTFILSVPTKINLLGASLQPVITVEVTTERDAVILQATDCQLNATGIIGGLDDRFAMQFTTRLTWRSPQHQQPHLQQFSPQVVAQQHQRELDQLAAEQQQLKSQPSGTASRMRAGWDRIRQASWPSSNGNNGSTAAAAGQSQKQQQQSGDAALRGSITGSAVVDVWCEVIPPFNMMPREVLVGTCNAVISGLISSLLPWFTRQLAADYAKWAQDAAYRAERAARSKPQQASVSQQDSLNN